MTPFLLIVIAILIVALVYLMVRHDVRERVIEYLNEERHLGKEKRKATLLRHIRSRGKITNDEAEALLGVSHSTATLYFDELEAEGKIEQKGEGRGTHYMPIKPLRGTEPTTHER